MPSTTTAKPKKQINLLRGWPNPALLPTPALLHASQIALSDPSISVPGLLYGPDPGYQPLREEIAKWMKRFYSMSNSDKSVAADADRICITGGASQNLACVLQVFSDPLKTRVWMVAPCYYMACRIFEDAGVLMNAVGEGSEGIDLVALEMGLEKCKREEGSVKTLKVAQPSGKFYRHIVYCVPSFSNPSGKIMSLSHRKKLVQLARKYDVLIITDDVYDFLQWPTSSSTSSSSNALLPRLVDIDRTLEPTPGPEDFGNTVSNGSFSKISGPGVRTGWAEATPKFTYGLSQCGSSRSGGAPSQMTATIVTELLKSGDLERHIDGVLNPAYKMRYEIMIQAIQKYLIPLGVTVGEVSSHGNDVYGGYFIWLELPETVAAKDVAGRSKQEENLIVAPGQIFEVSNDPSIKFENSLRVCFSWEGEEDLEEGIARLARVVSDVEAGVAAPTRQDAADTKGIQKGLGEFK